MTVYLDFMEDYYSPHNQKNLRRTGNYSTVMDSLTKCPFCDLKSKYVIKRISGMYLTANLFPYIDGHLLIVSQRHVESINELTDKEWKAFFELVKLAQKRLGKNMKIKDFAVICQQGGKSGRSVKHFHISILPNPAKVIQKVYQEITITPLDLAGKLAS